MRGHIRKRGRSWSIVLDLGPDPVTGKRRQRWQTFPTKKEAEAELARLIHQVETGNDPFPKDQTFGDYACRWFEHAAKRLRPGTVYRYRGLLDRYIVPPLKDIRLSKLRPAHVQRVLDAMADQGLAPRTIIQARAVANSALSQAVAWGLIANNPVRAVKPPRVERAQLEVPTAEQLRRLIDTAAGTPWEVPILLAATTGMRRSEVLALRWSDVNLETARVHVMRSLQRINGGKLDFLGLKTTRARREIVLPTFAVAALRAHRKRQAEQRLIAGSAWQGEAFGDLVCATALGQPIDPDNFSHAFKRIAAKAGVPAGVRLHDARHGVATALLERKVHPAIASAMLGHSSEAFTMATYQHVTPRMAEEAAKALEVALGE